MANFGSAISTFDKIFSETFKSIFFILICLENTDIKKEKTIIRPKKNTIFLFMCKKKIQINSSILINHEYELFPMVFFYHR